MASDDIQQEDRTEEATPERRDDFREKGQLVVSRELTSVVILAGCVLFFTYFAPFMLGELKRLFVTDFESISVRRINAENAVEFATEMWLKTLYFILPCFAVTAVAASASTMLQTRLNWSWQRLAPDFSKMDPLTGLARMVNMQAGIELIKGIMKMVAIGVVPYLILVGEWGRIPELMNYTVPATWSYWGDITTRLFWSVSGLLLFVAGVDYFYNFMSFERRIKMTKQEVKEEYKRREVDPHLKARMRRMQRDMVMKRTLEKTKEATVLITNPTHFSIALKYELGMPAPILVAKGIDFLALEMRKVAKDLKIPIIENRPLARELHATVEEGEEVPDRLYKVVAEIIRYVFKLKNKPMTRADAPRAKPPVTPEPNSTL